MKIISMLLEVLYPSCCPGCGKATAPDKLWCKDCLALFWNPRLLNASFSKHLSGCYTVCEYDEGIRRALIGLKYSGKTEYKRAFPELLDAFPYWGRLSAFHTAMPVPLSQKRKRERRYNQVDMIFQDWLENHGWEYVNEGLARVRDTKVQSLLDKEKRRQNVKGAFHLNHGVDVKGKDILLLDDVYTTGTTLEEAASELKRMGAKTVAGLTLASGAR
ncbi:MAG: ComF family protein [Dialister sp.]|nr:ComF family protein [Dialister sp.]